MDCNRQQTASSAGQTGVSLERLSREPLFIPSRQPLQSEILNWFSSASESYQIFALYNQLAGIIPLIAQNTGVAICPESVKLYTDDRRLAYLKITEPEPTSHLYMICGRNRAPIRRGKSLLELRKTVL